MYIFLNYICNWRFICENSILLKQNRSVCHKFSIFPFRRLSSWSYFLCKRLNGSLWVVHCRFALSSTFSKWLTLTSSFINIPKMQKYKVQKYQDYDYINSQFTSLDHVMTFVTIFNLLCSSLAVSIPCYTGSFYVLFVFFLILNKKLKNNLSHHL